jgi:hypothetical protein
MFVPARDNKHHSANTAEAQSISLRQRFAFCVLIGWRNSLFSANYWEKKMNLRNFFRSLTNIAIGACLITMTCLFIITETKAQTAAPTQNPIDIENDNEGTSNWQIVPLRRATAGGRETEGYASHTSVNIGETITFYVSTSVTRNVDIVIYRMGWYQGLGGRYITTLADKPVTQQPLDEADHRTGLIECNWAATATWTPPADITNKAVSGFYLAKIVGKANPGEDRAAPRDSYIIFVVRDDARSSDFIFQSAVTTYQAYNDYPGDRNVSHGGWFSGKNLYKDHSHGNLVPETGAASIQDKQARMVSFNRPYLPQNNNIYYSAGQFFRWEYNFVRWMEKNDLDVTYITNIDTHKATNLTSGIFSSGKHKAFLTAGHDEYWSWEMRDNIERARNRTTTNESPLHLGFFSSNDVYWQIRFKDSSPMGTNPAGAGHRTMIAYKEHVKDTGDFGDPNYVDNIDQHKITDLWRRNLATLYPGACSTCYKGAEDELTGVMTNYPAFIEGEGHYKQYYQCPAWMKVGVTDTDFPYLIGNEPAKLLNTYPNRATIKVSESEAWNNNTSEYVNGVYYKLTSGGRVFAGGTNYWAWGIDSFPLNEPNVVIPGGWQTGMYNAQFATMTMNILNCFKQNGGSACGE